MKKVISITLGRVVYNIEEDAYEKLRGYLDEVQTHFKDNDDKSEIIDDIESSIAEKFYAKGRSEKTAVTMDDVESVIKDLGSVSDFDDGEEGEEKSGETRSKSGEKKTKKVKRMFRNTDDRIIGGVSSGIAAYFGIDPLFIRILFIIVTLLSGGTGIIVYLVLWLIIPEAKSASQKIEMKGDPVTIETITENVTEGVENLKKKDEKGTFRKIVSVPVEIVRAVAKFLFLILRYTIPVLAVIIGLSLVVSAAVAIAAIVIAAVGILSGIDIWMINSFDLAPLSEWFGSTSSWVALIVSVAFTALIPLLFLLLTGTSLTARKSSFTLAGSLSLLFIWVAALALTFSIGARHVPTVVNQVNEIRLHEYAEELIQERTYSPAMSIFPFTPFDKVELKGGSYIYSVTAGDAHQVYIKTTKDIDRTLDVSSEDGTFRIERKDPYDFCIIFDCYSAQPVYVEIITPELTNFSADDYSRGTIEGFEGEF